MAYFSLLYETIEREHLIKEISKKQLYRNNILECERKFEFVGNRMVSVTNCNQATYPAFFIDLNLDQVVKTILYHDIDSKLTETFYELLQSQNDITYRQEIFKDLDNPYIYESIIEFQNSISQVYRLLEYKDQANHLLQKNKYHLDALVLTQTCIINLINHISEIVRSTGLKNLMILLKTYTTTDSFTNLRNTSLSLLSRIESIYYSLTIAPNKVLIRFEKIDRNFNKDLCSIFKNEHRIGNDISFFRQVILSNLELKIADIIYTKEKALFNQCDKFVKNNPEIMPSIIPQLHEEMKFYISCHDYLNSIRENNFPISYPELTDGFDIDIYDLYDVNLAYKAKLEADIVKNNFILKQGEAGAWITGANQGGKTTFARSIGQLVYFTLIGMPVPAASAKLPLYYNILTHFTCEENSTTDNGKLKEELLKLKDLLNHSNNRKSLFILNELFSSTTTIDAYDMCNIFINKILEHNATVICVTHIPQLTSACKKMISLGTELINNDKHTRTFKIIPKTAEATSYASDIADKYKLSFNQIKERIGYEY